MSAKSNMTNSVRSSGGGGSLRGNSLHEKLHATSSSEEKVMLAAEESKDRLYEPKRDKKMVRVLTVVVYVFSVSLAAIMLSLYYVFFWEPKGPHYVKPKVSPTNFSSTGAALASLALRTPPAPPPAPPSPPAPPPPCSPDSESGDPPMKEPAASSGSQLQPPGPPPAGDTFTSAPHAPDFNTAAAATATRTGSQPTLNTDRDVNQTKKFSEGRLNVITPKTS